MKTKNLAITVLFLLAVAVIPAAAQNEIRANIPFNFLAGRQAMPAGTYSFSKLDDSGRTMIVRQLDGDAAAMLIVGYGPGKNEKRGTLRFTRVRGDEAYVLTSLWPDSEDMAESLVLPKRRAAAPVESALVLPLDQ